MLINSIINALKVLVIYNHYNIANLIEYKYIEHNIIEV